MSAESEMRDCSRYILSRIDKDVGIGARLVRVKSDNPAVIELETLDKKHIIRFYCEKRRIYRRIVTRAGSGVNPLYINDVFVEDWHVRTLGEKRIMVSYRLKMGNHSQYFQQLIFCHNGIVQDSGV